MLLLTVTGYTVCTNIDTNHSLGMHFNFTVLQMLSDPFFKCLHTLLMFFFYFAKMIQSAIILKTPHCFVSTELKSNMIGQDSFFQLEGSNAMRVMAAEGRNEHKQTFYMAFSDTCWFELLLKIMHFRSDILHIRWKRNTMCCSYTAGHITCLCFKFFYFVFMFLGASCLSLFNHKA